MSDPLKPTTPPTATQKWVARGIPSDVEAAKARLRGRRPAKPKKAPTRPVAVRLPIKLWDAIDVLAEHFDVDRTQVVKRAFEDALRKYGKKVEGLLENAGLPETAKPNPFDAFSQTQEYAQPEPGFTVPFQQYGIRQEPVLATSALPPLVLPQGGHLAAVPYTPPEEGVDE